jgi:hypothetical protein
MGFAKSLGSFVLLAVLIPASGFAAAAPATSPTTQNGPLAERLTFLTLQLSSTEESIKAINLVLRSAGYKAALAADRAADAEKGNELMDRKGGAPIPWDQFYGKTARDFIAPLPPGTRVTIKGKGQIVYPTNDPIRRPAQMDYIYRANNEQAAKARAEAAAVGKKIDSLLARRRQLETEQSGLWATISWESMQSREVALRPLYRFKLKAAKADPAPQIQILRPSILFLRTVDKTVAGTQNLLAGNDEQALKDLSDVVQPAAARLQQSLADALLAEGLDAADRNLGRELADLSKQMAATCRNMTDAYRLALDGDAAQDESRKLRFRAALQESMLDFAETFGRMDNLVTKLAETWNISGEKGVPSEDKIPATEKRADADARPAVATPNPVAAAATPAPGESLFDGKTLTGWEGDSRYWSVVDGAIRGRSTDKSNNYLFAKGEIQNFRLQAQFKFISGNSGILFRCEPAAAGQFPGGYEADIYLPNAVGKLGFDEKVLVRPDAALLKKSYRRADWNSYTIEANGEHIRLWINDQLTVDRQHHGPASGRIALELYGPTEIYFRDLRINRLP